MSFMMRGEEMKDTLKLGMEYEYQYIVKNNKLVPALYPEADEFLVMPNVFATGFLVGLIEWVCIQSLTPHLDWPAEQSVGIHIDISHMAATPPDFEISVKVKLVEITGKKLIFEVTAHDGIDLISKGRHGRFIINKEQFDSRLNDKIAAGSK